MKTQFMNWKKCFGILALGLCAALETHAQPFFPGFGGGGFGGGAFGGGNQARSSITYNPAGSIGNANILVEPDSRNIVINADSNTTAALMDIIKNLDRPQPQVLIKVVFLEVTHNNSSDIGIEGSYNGQSSVFGRIANYLTNYSIFTNQTITSTTGTSTTTTSTEILPGQLIPQNSSYVINNGFNLAAAGAQPNGAGQYSILGQDFTATIRAIAQNGKSQLLSRPSILARNNQQATIQVGQDVPLITAVTYDTFGNAHNSISYQPVGIILKVTPFITADGLVQMIIQPSTSEIDNSQVTPVAAGVYAPAIDVRSADTVVITPDSQTVVIGGLMENDSADTVSKIPILGDIPVLGALFRHTTKSDAKTELIIFLTPHVIQAPSQLASLGESEKNHMLTPKSYSEEELDRFLEKVPVKKPDSKSK